MSVSNRTIIYKNKLFISLLSIFLFCNTVIAGPKNITFIESYNLKEDNFHEQVISVGKIKFKKSKDFYTKLDGTVDLVSIEQNQHVKKDEILIKIESKQAEALKFKAESALKAAKTAYDRDISLAKKKIISQDILDKSKLSFDSANLELVKANKSYSNMIIKAPFDGYIGVLRVNELDEVKMGNYLFSIIAEGEKELFIDLPEKMYGRIDNNSEAYVKDLDGKEVQGSVVAVSKYLDDKGTITARLSFPKNTKLIHNGFTEVKIIFNRHKGLSVPEKIVLKNNEGNFVYKISADNIVEQIYVKTKTRSKNFIEILSDQLKIGDKLVLEGLTKVGNGSKVVLIDAAKNNK